MKLAPPRRAARSTCRSRATGVGVAIGPGPIRIGAPRTTPDWAAAMSSSRWITEPTLSFSVVAALAIQVDLQDPDEITPDASRASARSSRPPPRYTPPCGRRKSGTGRSPAHRRRGTRPGRHNRRRPGRPRGPRRLRPPRPASPGPTPKAARQRWRSPTVSISKVTAASPSHRLCHGGPPPDRPPRLYRVPRGQPHPILHIIDFAAAGRSHGRNRQAREPASRRRLRHGAGYQPSCVLEDRRRGLDGRDATSRRRPGPRAGGQRTGPAGLHRRRQSRLPALEGLPGACRRPGRRPVRRVRALSVRGL